MSDTFDHSGLPEDELLAAEYALGVLDGIDRATAEQRMARDRGFARQVAAWEQRLTPWAAEIPEMLPAPHVWDRIAGALPPQPARAGLWQSLAFWRGLSFAAGALAAACIAALVYFGAFTPTEPLVATIEGGGQRPGWQQLLDGARIDRDGAGGRIEVAELDRAGQHREAMLLHRLRDGSGEIAPHGRSAHRVARWLLQTAP